MLGQAFLYNAIFFTYALVLATFCGIDNSNDAEYQVGGDSIAREPFRRRNGL